jgi:hypothetical protein
MNGYIGFYNGKRMEIYAETSYAAYQKAIDHWKVPKTKRGMVSVVIAEKDGKPVVHSPVF